LRTMPAPEGREAATAAGAEPTRVASNVADRATEARPAVAARLRRECFSRRRTAFDVCRWARDGVGVVREREETGVVVNAEGIVGDLSLVGQGHADERRARTLFWLGGPHICAFNAPAGHREGWTGLASRAGCASGCSCPIS